MLILTWLVLSLVVAVVVKCLVHLTYVALVVLIVVRVSTLVWVGRVISRVVVTGSIRRPTGGFLSVLLWVRVRVLTRV